ncbi:hypothetical protein ES703_120676 [subsurface metagenome]
MSTDAIGLCVTIGIGIIFLMVGIGISIFLGLRGFTNRVNDKVTDAKDDIVEELSDIKGTLTKIDTTANNLIQIATGAAAGAGTVIRQLKNFGETRITAIPGSTNTTYTISVEKGIIDTDIMGRASQLTGLTEREVKMFGGQTVKSFPLGRRRFRLTVPSTDPKVCTEYMSLVLNWLDTEYQNELHGISAFEDNIKIDRSD